MKREKMIENKKIFHFFLLISSNFSLFIQFFFVHFEKKMIEIDRRNERKKKGKEPHFLFQWKMKREKKKVDRKTFEIEK